jgi:hypothetical protein
MLVVLAKLERTYLDTYKRNLLLDVSSNKKINLAMCLGDCKLGSIQNLFES